MLDLSSFVLPVQRPPAIIIGLRQNGLGVARALQQEGIPAIVLTHDRGDPALWTRACQKVRLTEWDETSVISSLLELGRFIGNRYSSKPPILVTQDAAVMWLSRAREALSEFFSILLPDPDTVDLLMDKARFSQYARDRGWPLPRTFAVASQADFEAVRGDIPFPCIVKPAVKNAAYRNNASEKAHLAEDSVGLERVYSDVAQWESEMVLQEFIPGGDDHIAYCLAYYDASGRPKAVYPGIKLRQWPPFRGGTAVAAPCPAEWKEMVVGLTKEIFDTVGYRGLGSVEFKMHPADGRPRIVEPTVGRTNYQSEIAVLNGVNIPAIAYWDMIGEPGRIATRHNSRATKLIDVEHEKLASAMLMRKGLLDQTERRRILAGPRKQMYFRWNDPLPGVANSLSHLALGRLAEAVFGRRFRMMLRSVRGYARERVGR